MDKEMLGKWLKCGFVETKKLFPTEEGTPQGGTISPVLMNMTLDGLERILKERFPTAADGLFAEQVAVRPGAGKRQNQHIIFDTVNE